MRLEVIARKAGIPYLEYASMPIGELSDFVDFYAESEGGCKIVSRIDTEFIPLEVR